jgi:hypothetical protein
MRFKPFTSEVTEIYMLKPCILYVIKINKALLDTTAPWHLLQYCRRVVVPEMLLVSGSFNVNINVRILPQSIEAT